MDTSEQNSQSALCAEILREARQEAERLVDHARKEAGALVAQAKANAERLRQERLTAAATEAARRRELILATIPVETNRQRLAAVEAVLQSVYEQANRLLAENRHFEFRSVIITLASEAIRNMAGERFVVKLAAGKHPVDVDGLPEAITARVGRSPLSVSLSHDSALSDSGVIVEDAEGRQSCDERLQARLVRLWPALRREIAIRASLVENRKPGGNP